MLLAGGELAPSGARGREVSRVRFFGGGECAEACRAAIAEDARNKSRPIAFDALQLQAIVTTGAAIDDVLRFRRISQIGPSIVEAVPVVVINEDRISASHPFEYDAVRQIPGAIDLAKLATAGDRAERSPGMSCIPSAPMTCSGEMRARSLSPPKLAGLWIVVEAFAQILLRRQWLGQSILLSGSACHAI